ncbi:hypothetical protein HW452_15555 [Halomonas aquamarina]|uniref:Uncharacterized protein n=1 Tax=Vreelandella aquamarina TaxID=77097 RepID=A0ACC5VYK2_9GAMM|nr:hypothetical protein [Halomonas aquamarina]MBZ5488940.1 hypothetical protein [Halomonas aquamarina]
MTQRMTQRLHLTHPGHFVGGLILWSIWFVAAYGGLSVACAVVPPDAARGAFTPINASLLLMSLLTVVLIAALAWGCFREARLHRARRHFNAKLSAWLYLFSALAVVFVSTPMVGLPPCL